MRTRISALIALTSLISVILVTASASAQATPDAYLSCYNWYSKVSLNLTDTTPGVASAQYFVADVVNSGRTHHYAPVILGRNPAGPAFRVSVSQQGNSVIYESNGFKFVVDTKGSGDSPASYQGRVFNGALNHEVELYPDFECRFVKIERHTPPAPRRDPRCNYNCHV